MADSALNQFKPSWSTNTSSIAPSTMDLVLALPRLARRIGVFALFYLPEQIDGLFVRMGSTGGVIAEATAERMLLPPDFEPPTTFMADFAPSAQARGSEYDVTVSNGIFNLQNIRNLGGIFNYITSRWALATFTVVRYHVSTRVSEVITHDCCRRFF
jgi:hypothetical protein